ncbi:MAG: type II secretion system minor pseudopilin GspJ [Pseudomonadota bacterium]
MKRMHTSRGFTLLELVVVIAIFGVMSVMAYGGLSSVLTSRARVEEALNRTADLQKTYMRLRSDFQQVEPRPIRDEFGVEQPAFIASPGVDRTEFTRGGWRNPLGHERSGFERVSYRLDDKKLLRETWRVLDRAQDSQPVKTELLDGVEELRWRFLDANRQWQTQWPAALPAIANSPPPLAVEITLVTRNAGELRFLFRT